MVAWGGVVLDDAEEALDEIIRAVASCRDPHSGTTGDDAQLQLVRATQRMRALLTGASLLDGLRSVWTGFYQCGMM